MKRPLMPLGSWYRAESRATAGKMEWQFFGEAIEWRGPAPYVFVPAPPDVGAEIREMSSRVSYGWGCIPCKVRLGQTEAETALFPKDGTYLVPIRVSVQRAEGIKIGDRVHVCLVVNV